jgi:hypothetical protein
MAQSIHLRMVSLFNLSDFGRRRVSGCDQPNSPKQPVRVKLALHVTVLPASSNRV